jgi:hypothetical protein
MENDSALGKDILQKSYSRSTYNDQIISPTIDGGTTIEGSIVPQQRPFLGEVHTSAKDRKFYS